MSTIFTPTPMRISVEMYQKMISTGVLTKNDRVELIDGEILEMAPLGPKHAAFVARLNQILVLAVGARAMVAPSGAVDLGAWSQRQPDLMLLRPRTDYYATAHPGAQGYAERRELCTGESIAP